MRHWLRNKRLGKNMTQKDVAKKVGVERAYYTMIESNYRNPSIKIAKKIAEILEFERR